jgi:undecaprenyl-diphosphatase
MPDWLSAVFLGIIEGLTEFLPVSSTGHLLLAQNSLLLPKQSDLFNVVIQSGAVIAVLLAFSTRAKDLLVNWATPENRDYLAKLAVAFGITGAGGLIIKKLELQLPEKVAPVAWATLIGGLVIFAVEAWAKKRAPSAKLTWSIAIAVAVAQLVAAVFPGTSRSGACILVALALGLGRPMATEFSFLVGVPTLLAAGGLKIVSAIGKGTAGDEKWGLVLIATLAAAASAFVVVKWLMRFVQTHTLVVFGWYRIVLGAALLLFFRDK